MYIRIEYNAFAFNPVFPEGIMDRLKGRFIINNGKYIIYEWKGGENFEGLEGFNFELLESINPKDYPIIDPSSGLIEVELP